VFARGSVSPDRTTGKPENVKAPTLSDGFECCVRLNDGTPDEAILLGSGTILNYVEGAVIEPPDESGQGMGIVPPASARVRPRTLVTSSLCLM